jgi:hypothetical protein
MIDLQFGRRNRVVDLLGAKLLFAFALDTDALAVGMLDQNVEAKLGVSKAAEPADGYSFSLAFEQVSNEWTCLSGRV